MLNSGRLAGFFLSGGRWSERDAISGERGKYSDVGNYSQAFLNIWPVILNHSSKNRYKND